MQHFINASKSPPENNLAISQTHVWETSVRQENNPEWAGFLLRVRNGQLGSEEDEQFFKKRLLDTLPTLEKATFKKEALYIYSSWRETIPVLKEYLDSMPLEPIARCKHRIETRHRGGKNHLGKGDAILSPAVYLCRGSMVMLLTNISVSEKLYNGSIGTVVDIVYELCDTPSSDETALPLFVVVDFPGFQIKTGKQPWHPQHPTWIPIIPAIALCQKRCCSQTQIPLIVCKSLTVHKAQGMSIGLGNPFKKIVFTFSRFAYETHGLIMVALTRAVNATDIAFGNIPSVIEMKQIGKGPSYENDKKFIENLRVQSVATADMIKQKLSVLVPSTPTWQAGYEYLCGWYDGLHRQSSHVNYLIFLSLVIKFLLDINFLELQYTERSTR